MAKPSYPHRGVLAVRFTINVFLGSTIIWATLRSIQDTNPIWAIASMLSSTDPQVGLAARMFKSRLTNVLVGCGVGLFFLIVFGSSTEWVLPITLAATVLVSSYLVGVQTMWRQAPITAAIVIAAGLNTQTRLHGLEVAIHKVLEVIFGCLVGLLVSWLLSRIWPLPADSPDEEQS